jgi:hypothetical protein
MDQENRLSICVMRVRLPPSLFLKFFQISESEATPRKVIKLFCTNLYKNFKMETLFNILSRIQKSHPELRIGQIIVNAIPIGHLDLFYVEDYDLIFHLLDFEKTI